MRRATFLVLLLGLLPARLFAQADPNAPDPAKVKVRLGPVMMNPEVTFKDIGIDENVFNEATDPKRDFSVTISPRTELFLRFMGTWFNGAINEDIVWYRTYTSERQSNSTRTLGWKMPLTRLTTNLQATRTQTRERPGYEIDERAQRTMINYKAVASFKLLYNMAVDFNLTRNSVEYDEGVEFRGVQLRDQLNVVTDSIAIGIKQTLTPLTFLTAGLVRTRDNYRFQPLRDAETTDAKVALNFDPKAVLKGNLSLGLTKFRPLSDTIPAFTGVTLSADMNFAVRGATKFTIRADRQVQNSYDINQPYFLQTGFYLEVAQQVLGRVDLVVRGGLERMTYRDLAGAIVEAAGRTDRVETYGLGAGYHLGKNLRIGLNYDQTRRRSQIASREYERPRVGSSVTYDF